MDSSRTSHIVKSDNKGASFSSPVGIASAAGVAMSAAALGGTGYTYYVQRSNYNELASKLKQMEIAIAQLRAENNGLRQALNKHDGQINEMKSSSVRSRNSYYDDYPSYREERSSSRDYNRGPPPERRRRQPVPIPEHPSSTNDNSGAEEFFGS